MDVGFFRDDYERFCQVFPQEADSSKYFLQTWKTDKYYRWNYGKIRRVGTEYVRAGQEHMKYRTGISIDIFPYDYLPIDKELDEKVLANWKMKKEILKSREMRPLLRQARMCACLRKAAYSVVGKYQAPQWHMRLLYGLLSMFPGRLAAALMEKTARKYNDAEQYGRLRVRQFGYTSDWKTQKIGWYADKLAGGAEIEFEGFRLFGVKDVHWYLTESYGANYLEIPPKKLRYAVAPASKIDFGHVFEQMEWCTEEYLHK